MEKQFSIKQPGVLDSIEKQLTLARKLEDVYNHRPNPIDFIGAMAGTNSASLYTKEKIEEDLLYVETRKKQFEEQQKAKGAEVLTLLENGFSLSEMMQAMIVDMINKGMLPNFKAMMTSERDDIGVGVDAVLKRKEGGYMGAAFDFTISGNETVIADKLEKNWNENIVKHKIPVVKYFQDPDTNKKSSLLIPKFIIGGTKSDIEVFAKAYLEGKENDLINHPFKFLMVKQIDEQLKAELSFFLTQKDNPEFDFISKIYKKTEIFIENLKEEIKYNEYIKTKEFFDYKKESKAYHAMKEFYEKKSEVNE